MNFIDFLNHENFVALPFKKRFMISFDPADFTDEQLAMLDSTIEKPLRTSDGIRQWGFASLDSAPVADFLALKMIGKEYQPVGSHLDLVVSSILKSE